IRATKMGMIASNARKATDMKTSRVDVDRKAGVAIDEPAFVKTFFSGRLKYFRLFSPKLP
ncbi:MAG: hypothetical protein K2H64_02210, partial [Desulfovibrio sp.]|nr:hypothetical protein [Desulfovibrio sp.]